MSYLLAQDTLNGAEGSIVITVNGQNTVIAGMRNIQTVADIQSEDMRTIGTRKIQQKPNGANLTGTGNIYYGSNIFTDIVLDYINNGKVTQFDIQITNSDPSTSVGSQVMAYYGCTLTGEIPLSILDSEEAMLNYDFEFAYTDVKRLQAFTTPTNLGT